jgi:EAL domain-containing protein (putative c-di-GMP-specific phosphodiesterase class I)
MSDSVYRRRFPAGRLLFNEGHVADAAYIIETGAVEIFVEFAGERTRLAVLGPGEIFGEMALVDDAPRSAAALVVEDCEVIVVERGQIKRELETATPLMRILLRTLIHRLRVATSTLPQAQMPISTDEAARVIARIKSEHEVRRAIDGGELVPFLQPIVRLDDGVTVGFEALVRWRHPQHGLLGPETLLGSAERAGLLEALDLMVMRESARMLAALNRRLALAGRRPVFLSANFGAAHFADDRLADVLAEILAEAGLPPERLKVEITETTLIVNRDAHKALARIKALGAAISLDDFGTGYSGLSYLSQFPIDYLKIDKSFVSTMLDDRKTAEIIRSVVQLASQLEIDAIAEGVETPAQAEFLRSVGCVYGQGYFYGAAQPAEHACAALFDRQ